MSNVVVINRDELSEKCSEAIHIFLDEDKVSGSVSVLTMTLVMFSALLVSRVFEDEEDQNDENGRTNN